MNTLQMKDPILRVLEDFSDHYKTNWRIIKVGYNHYLVNESWHVYKEYGFWYIREVWAASPKHTCSSLSHILYRLKGQINN